jgi:hypothetical protein
VQLAEVDVRWASCGARAWHLPALPSLDAQVQVPEGEVARVRCTAWHPQLLYLAPFQEQLSEAGEGQVWCKAQATLRSHLHAQAGQPSLVRWPGVAREGPGTLGSHLVIAQIQPTEFGEVGQV